MHKFRLLLFALLLPHLVHSQVIRNGTQDMQINGVRHWVKIGGAQHHTTPLVIIHGGPGGNHYVFERMAGKDLETFATVIYYEQRGSGRSAASPDGEYSVAQMVSDLEALRTQLGIKQWIPLGYSFGASLALEYALAHPQNVKGMILESFATLQDSSVLLGQMANFYSQATAGSRPRMDSILNRPSSITEKNMAFWNLAKKEDVIRFLFKGTEKGREVFDLWAESKIPNTGEVMRSLLKERRKVNLYDQAHQVTAPTLLLTGVYDRNGALPASIRISNEISHSAIRFFENSAHFPDVEERALFVETIRTWYLSLK